jgi:hypothetical protein
MSKGGRQILTDRETDIETARQADRQTGRQTNKLTNICVNEYKSKYTRCIKEYRNNKSFIDNGDSFF